MLSRFMGKDKISSACQLQSWPRMLICQIFRMYIAMKTWGLFTRIDFNCARRQEKIIDFNLARIFSMVVPTRASDIGVSAQGSAKSSIVTSVRNN